MLLIWLNLPTWQQFLVLATLYTGVACLLFWLAFGPRTATFSKSFAGVAPSYFSVPATLFALMTGFVASDAWEIARQATRVVQSESDDVFAIYELSRDQGPDGAALRATLRTYVNAVIADEWPAMTKGTSSAKADEALDMLFRHVSGPKADARPSGVSPPIQASLLNLVLKLRGDRGTRLDLNEHQTDGPKWLTLLILGILTQVAIAAVHIDRPRAHIIAMAIFTIAVVSTQELIAIHEWPFDGPSAIRPIPLMKALERISVEARADRSSP